MSKAPQGATPPHKAAQTLKVVIQPITQVNNWLRTLNFRRLSQDRIDTTGVQWGGPVTVWFRYGDVEVWKVRSGKGWVARGEYDTTPTIYLLVRIKREPNPLGMAEVIEQHEPGKHWRTCHQYLREAALREAQR